MCEHDDGGAVAEASRRVQKISVSEGVPILFGLLPMIGTNLEGRRRSCLSSDAGFILKFVFNN